MGMEQDPVPSQELPAAGAHADRLRELQLLRASGSIADHLSLSSVLLRVVEAACELVEAPYGALGVIRPDGGGLEEFVHVGVDDATVAAIGRLPEGKGLLGALIEDPRPIRLGDISADLRSVGFPDHHPPMRGFLGVPITVGDEVFGNLYLASPDEGNFSAEDEQLVLALATTAGTAIENARLYAAAERRQDWLAASTDVTRKLLSATSGDALQLVAQYVYDLADADVVTIVRPDRDVWEVEVAVGLAAERLAGARYPIAHTLSEVVMETGQPSVVDDASAIDPESRSLILTEVLAVGPVMLLPLASSGAVSGVLMVGRSAGGRRFSPPDVEMATTFAHHAALALELATARRRAQRMELVEDRSRIARDLHDHVIQQLFAAGMTLQGVAVAVRDDPAAAVIDGVVDTIDDAIRQIRASIFQLRPPSMLGSGLRAQVLDVVTDVTASLGFDPQVHFSGPVDSMSGADLATEVAAVVRESLVNVAKHARAQRVEVTVSVTGQSLRVVVEDDGVGISRPARRSGLDNLRERAHRHGGTLQVTAGASGGGTRLVWEVEVA